MNATFTKLSAVAIAFSMSVAIPAAYSQGKGNAKAKGKQNVEAKEKHGREAGELPHGLEQFSGHARENLLAQRAGVFGVGRVCRDRFSAVVSVARVGRPASLPQPVEGDIEQG